LRYLERPNEAHLQNAAGTADLADRYRRCQRKPALLVSPDAKSAFSGADYRRANSSCARFLRELDPDASDLHNLQQRYNALFLPEDGVHWLH
jgi:hypothetical protein